MKLFAGAGCRRVACDLHFLPEKVLLWTSNYFTLRRLSLKRVCLARRSSKTGALPRKLIMMTCNSALHTEYFLMRGHDCQTPEICYGLFRTA